MSSRLLAFVFFGLVSFAAREARPITASAPLVPLTVTAMSPSPGTVVSTDVTQVTVTLSGDVDPLTVSTTTVLLKGAGTDNLFDTADDVTVTPSSVSVSGGNQIVISLSSALGNGLYRVKLIGTATEPTGCVHRWTLDEGAGTTAEDSVGTADGTVSGATWTTGRVSNGLSFNGPPFRIPPFS